VVLDHNLIGMGIAIAICITYNVVSVVLSFIFVILTIGTVDARNVTNIEIWAQGNLSPFSRPIGKNSKQRIRR
jgi:hypothetical protein